MLAAMFFYVYMVIMFNSTSIYTVRFLILHVHGDASSTPILKLVCHAKL